MILDLLENLAKKIQLKIMRPSGMERISDRAVYFHPNDVREKILTEYKKKVSKI